MDVLPQGKLLDHEDILKILERLEQGERIENIFGPSSVYPRFAHADFRKALRDEPYKSIYESIQVLRSHKIRSEIEDMREQELDRHDVPVARFRLDVLKHLATTEEPEQLHLRDDDTQQLLKAAVVFLPPKTPKGLVAQLENAVKDNPK